MLQQLAQRLVVLRKVIRVRLAACPGTGIEHAALAAVADGVATGRGRLDFKGVQDGAGDDIIVLTQALQVTPGIRIDGVKITQDEHQAAGPGDPAQTGERFVEMTAVRNRFDAPGRVGSRDQFANDA